MRILINTPTYGYQSHTHMVGSLITELQTLRSQGHHAHWNYVVSSALAWARNMAVDSAIKNDYDWLFFWDADVSVGDLQDQTKTAGFIEKMIELAQEKEAGVVGVPYSLKHFPTEWAIRDLDGNRMVADINAGHQTKTFGEGKDKVDIREMPTEPFEVSQVATGLMLIKVDELKKLTPPWFTFIDGYKNNEVTVLPEDYMFCDYLRKNTKIYCDPRWKTMHWGQYPFGI